MDVVYHPEAFAEFQELPAAERAATANAVAKLESLGDRLPYPHSSNVRGTQLRELRPRAGRSQWRLLYRRVGEAMVILAVAPEAEVNPRGFRRACDYAERRYQDTAEG